MRLFAYPILMVLFIHSCGVVDSEEILKLDISGSVYLEYNGIESAENGDKAMFTLVNDSTVSVQYFAYDASSPHFSTEVLSDSGWDYLFWNSCGTGAEYFELEAGSSMQFSTVLPHESCTWRVMLSLIDPDLSNARILKSNQISYSTP